MPSDVPVGFRFTANGIDDTISRIKQLHEELNRGEITTREYRSEMREVTTNTKAATQEFNQIKGAVYAANPTLLEFTKTMSGFSQVAQTGLGITNALNLAVLNTSQSSDKLQDLKVKFADLTVEYQKFLKAFGENDPRTQAVKSELAEVFNQMGNEQQRVLLQSISNWITFGSSMILAVNQGRELVVFLKTLSATMNPLLVENFAIALTGIGSAMLTWVAPIAIVIAGIEGIYQLIKLLDPAFAEAGNNLEKSIMDNWHVDSIEATLLAPFIAFAGGIVDMADIVHANFVNLYNGILTDFINPLINTWDATIGKITGNISEIPTQFYHVPSKDEILQGFGLGSNALGSQSSTNPSADAINKMLVGSPTSSTSTSALNALQQNTLFSQAISQSQVQANTYLNSILATGQAANQVARQQLQQTQDQRAAIDALKQSIIDNTAKITELRQQPQTQLVATHYDSDTGAPIYDSIQATDAANQIAKLQQQNAQAASIIAGAPSNVGGLDNMTVGLGPVLASLGLDANTGIGSIVAGALGGYAGIGGAGTSASDIANFAATGDYGIFTRNAIIEGMPKTPTQQDQITAWLKAVNGKGMGTFTAADAARALNLPGSGTSSGSSNIGSGQFGGLPGQYGNPIQSVFNGNTGIFAASGFEGMVNGPTHFIAGEAGPEFVHISPTGKGSGNVNISISNNFEGSLLAENDFETKVQNTLKQTLKASGFT